MIIGSYVPVAGEEMLVGAVKETIANNANALMIYTGPPQNTRRVSVNHFRIAEAKALMDLHNIKQEHFIVHAPYIVNMAVNDYNKREFAISVLSSEVERTYALGSKILVFHPGNFLDTDIQTGIKNIASAINQVLINTIDTDVVLAIETMAGKGTEVGSKFSEISQIIELIDDKSRIGVCLDTCHIHDAGYDIVNNYEGVKKELFSHIAPSFIKVIHINDSHNDLGHRKDRHANIGEGYIGFEAIKRICNDSDFAQVAKILETPYRNGVSPYKEEIAALRK